MNKCVLDSSALLALLNQEPGSERLTPALMKGAVISAVNLAEVQTKLVSGGADPNKMWQYLAGLVPRIEPFDEDQARATGTLVGQTKQFGLSLGDRACIALGAALQLPIYTTDKTWAKVKLNVPIQLLR